MKKKTPKNWRDKWGKVPKPNPRDNIVSHIHCPRWQAEQDQRIAELAARVEAGLPLFPKKKGGAE